MLSAGCEPTERDEREIPEFSRPFDADGVPELWKEIEALETMSIRVRSMDATGVEVLPGIRFRLEVPGRRRGSVAESHEGVTGERGELMIPVTRWVKKRQDHLEWPAATVRVLEPGYQNLVFSSAVETEDISVREIEVRARPGGTIRGRLFGHGGERCGGKWSAWSHGEDPRWLGGGTLRRTEDSDLHIESTEGPYWIQASSLWAGMGVAQGLRLDGEDDGPLRLDLEGVHGIRGRLVRLDGRPITEAEVRAVASEIVALEGGQFMDEARALELKLTLAGGGRLRCTAEVDSTGAFHLRGLRAGAYELFFALPPGQARWLPLGEGPIEADGVDRTFQVRRPRIRVRHVDGNGQRVKLSIQSPPLLPFLSASNQWPEAWRVAAHEVWDPSLVGVPEEIFLRGHRSSGGDVLFDAAPGTRYRVGILGAGLAWDPQEIRVPEDGSPAILDLRSPARCPEGRLILSVEGPDGQPSRWSDLRVRIVDSRFGIPLVATSVRPSDGGHVPMEIPLPEGRWGLEVEDRTRVGDYHGLVLAERRYGGFSTTFQIVGGRDTEVTARLDEGARIAMRVEGAMAGASPSPWNSDQDRWRFAGLHDDSSMRWTNGRPVFAALRAPGRWPIELVTQTPSHYGGMSLVSWADPLTTTLFEKVPAGEYRLEAWTTDGKIVEQPVTLVEGKTTPVTVRFQ